MILTIVRGVRKWAMILAPGADDEIRGAMQIGTEAVVHHRRDRGGAGFRGCAGTVAAGVVIGSQSLS